METLVTDRNGRVMLEMGTPDERVWTPVLAGAGGGSGQTYAVQRGFYARLAHQVFVSAFLTLTAKGTLTGDICLFGLPARLDPALGPTVMPPLHVGWFDHLGSNAVWLGARVRADGPLGTRIALYGLNAPGASPAALPPSAIGNTTSLQVSGWYPVE